MPAVERLTAAAARRIALAAAGFADAPARVASTAQPDRRHLHRVLGRTSLLQIDSVSVVVRAHYLPVFSRLGPYPRTLVDEAAWGKRRSLFEYWAHEASLLPVGLQPHLRWRMARARALDGIYGGLAAFARERPEAVRAALHAVETRGALAASDLEGERGKGGWWGWSEPKRALEFLFWAGEVTTRTRRGFERVYDLAERVLPRAVLDTPTPDEAEAHRTLLRLSAQALGVGTAADLRDYFRLDARDVPARLAELVEAGELLPAEVEGWDRPAWLDPLARRPRRVRARALLAPFDPLVWERARAERLFGFRYRLEIYTPAEQRVHGYYVLPFLLGEHLVGRVDLRSNRRTGALEVLAAHAEPHAPADTARELAAELRRMAGWLGLGRVEAGPRGSLAGALMGELRAGEEALTSGALETGAPAIEDPAPAVG